LKAALCGFFLSFDPMKKLLASAVVLFAVGCGAPVNTQFALFSSYKLRDGEVSHYPVPKEKADEYGACCWMEGQNIFLNRAFTYGKGNQRVFIGVGEMATRGEFNAAIAADSSLTLFEQKRFAGKRIGYEAHFVKRDPFYLCRVNFIESKSGFFILIDHVFSDSTACKATYDTLEDQLETYIDVK
jgi:hypothetical protein